MILNPKICNIKLTPLIGVDLETTGLFPWMGAEVDLIAIYNELGDSYVLEADNYSKEDLRGLFEAIKKCIAIGHNIKFDCNFILYHYGVLLDQVFCTQIGAQIIDNGRQKTLKFNLIEVIHRFLGGGYSIDKEEKKNLQKSFIDPILRANLVRLPYIRKKQIDYAAEDTTFLIRLYHVQKEIIQEKALHIIDRLEHKVLPILCKMEVLGTKVAKVQWRSLIGPWIKVLESLEDEMDEEAKQLLQGKYKENRFKRNRGTFTTIDLFGGVTDIDTASSTAINYAAPAQIIELWLDTGEIPPKDDDGVYSVGETALEIYATEHIDTKLNKFIGLLLKYRKVSKLVSTYGESLLEKLDKYDCIHTSYTQTRTETGRLSSKQPNLQNIPSKGHGKELRHCFIARPGYKLITCDMAGAEVAIAADYSNEPLLLDSLRSGVDMHSKLASVSFRIIFDNPEIVVNKSSDILIIDSERYVFNDLRDEHKSVVFAKFYKAGAKRVYSVLSSYINRHHPASERLNIATKISTTLDGTMPVLSAYLSGLITLAKKDGYLRSDKLGRIRYFKTTVYGDAANYPIQGSNANALKIALIKCDEYLTATGYGHLVMNIHDEVVCEVLEDHAEEAAKEIKQIMSDALSYFLTNIKGGASVSINEYWSK